MPEIIEACQITDYYSPSVAISEILQIQRFNDIVESVRFASFHECSIESSHDRLDTVIKGSTEIDCIDDIDSEDVLPPPKPYYIRKSATQTSQSRCSSSASVQYMVKMFRRSKAITQSIPNLHIGRTQYNRRIGNTLELSRSQYSGQNRAIEFDAFLENL